MFTQEAIHACLEADTTQIPQNTQEDIEPWALCPVSNFCDVGNQTQDLMHAQ